MNVVSIAGDTGGSAGNVDDYGPDARLSDPRDIALDASGTKLYATDYANLSIRVLDLDSGYLDTLCTLEANPTHLCVTGDVIWVSARGAANHLYKLDRTDGTVDADVTPPGMLGSIAEDVDETGWWVKGPIGEFTTGWYRLAADGTLSFDNDHRDGAYGGDAGLVAVAGHTWKQHEYVSPAGHAFDTVGPPALGSGYTEAPIATQLAVSPWPESAGSVVFGPDRGVAVDMAGWCVTADAYVGERSVNLGFSTYGWKGIASNVATQTLFFSGANQIWMTDSTGRWQTRSLS